MNCWFFRAVPTNPRGEDAVEERRAEAAAAITQMLAMTTTPPTALAMEMDTAQDMWVF